MKGKLQQYQSYLRKTEKQKMKLIQDAKQEQHPSPDPQGEHAYPILNFIDFTVLDHEGKTLQLATYRYPSTSTPKAVVLMFHGYNSYLGHSSHIAHQLAQKGIQTVGFDHRGFGRSEGTPGYIHNMETHKSDSLKFAYKMKDMYPQVPLFCMGLSMGGLTTYYLTLTHAHLFSGAILLAPALKNIASFLEVQTVFLLKAIMPEQTRMVEPTGGVGSRNPKIDVKRFKDPLVNKRKHCVKSVHFLFNAMERCKETFKNYKCPFLAVQGGIDKLIHPMGVFDLFEQSPLGEQEKDIMFIEHMWHDLWHQAEVFDITAEVISWIQRRTSQNPESMTTIPDEKCK